MIHLVSWQRKGEIYIHITTYEEYSRIDSVYLFVLDVKIIRFISDQQEMMIMMTMRALKRDAARPS